MKIKGIAKQDPWLAPFAPIIENRILKAREKQKELCGIQPLSSFSNGHLYFGLHRTPKEWIFREWAPNATKIFVVGMFTHWIEREEFQFTSIGNGNWELKVPHEKIHHGDLYKLSIHWNGGMGERIPAYATRVVQDDETKMFSAQVWAPEVEYQWKFKNPATNEAPFIYEAHVGMATEDYRVGQLEEFRKKVLPRIIQGGYNTIQLMAIQEHPYYGSFGYHVSSLFAASSRFGTPEELKQLIDEAHGAGIKVIMDLIHSHGVKNTTEGLGMYDGSPWQFFHDGTRRLHPAWDSLCYNYKKNEVLHFLLSNIQFWLTNYKFDGFRFDGVTSMLYTHHGLNRDFTEYKMYFDGQQDEDAISYLVMANELIHEINPKAISVAEEMSGYPGLAAKPKDGGLGFDYRLAMGAPDYWIKTIKERPDEKWDVGEMYYELTNKRAEEKTIGYAESHDQALVGDQTLIFRLIGKEMYTEMHNTSVNLKIDRGIALHKMIRLLTLATAGNGYLAFMGNEFGHPEWIDFPREGNNWSYQYARRQWNLADNGFLRYKFLDEFDKRMIATLKKNKIFKDLNPKLYHSHTQNQVLCFERNELFFAFNFSPVNSYVGYETNCPPNYYKIILDTDQHEFGGQNRIDHNQMHYNLPDTGDKTKTILKLYLPSRTALVLKKV